MPFNRPALQEIRDRIAADIDARQPGLKLRYSPTSIIGQVNASEFHIVYGYQAYLARQMFPWSAEREYLRAHAFWWGVQASEATIAIGPAIFKAAIGSIIPANTSLRRADGLEYLVIADTIIASAEQAIDVTAAEPGSAGNAAAGVALTMTAPIVGVETVALVDTAGITGGTEDEADSSVSDRLQQRVQEPPEGGAGHDYVAWAMRFPGVTRAWKYRHEQGIGTVVVRFMMDDIREDGIPLPGDVEAMQAHLDELVPVVGEVFAVAPIAAPLAFEISVTPDTPQVRAAIEAQLRDLISREAIPAGTIIRSHVTEAVSLADGESDSNVVAPAASVPHTTGLIATFGGITWL